MPQLGIQEATFILLIFTTILSIQSRIFQVRTSIRESLEQLDDMELAGGLKSTPVLRKFAYFTLMPFGQGRTEVELIQYQPGRNPATASRPHTNKFNWFDLKGYPVEFETFLRALENIDGVHEARRSDRGIILTIHSRSAVEIRDITHSVMETIWMSRKSQRNYSN